MSDEGICLCLEAFIHDVSTRASSMKAPITASRDAVKSADDILSVIKSQRASSEGRTAGQLRAQAARLMLLLHKYARENLLVANIYIKDSADASIDFSHSGFEDRPCIHDESIHSCTSIIALLDGRLLTQSQPIPSGPCGDKNRAG